MKVPLINPTNKTKILIAKIAANQSIKIHVKSMSSNILTFDVKVIDKVRKIAEKVYELKDVNVENQSFMLNWKLLNKENYIYEYFFENESTVKLF